MTEAREKAKFTPGPWKWRVQITSLIKDAMGAIE